MILERAEHKLKQTALIQDLGLLNYYRSKYLEHKPQFRYGIRRGTFRKEVNGTYFENGFYR